MSYCNTYIVIKYSDQTSKYLFAARWTFPLIKLLNIGKNDMSMESLFDNAGASCQIFSIFVRQISGSMQRILSTVNQEILACRKISEFSVGTKLNRNI